MEGKAEIKWKKRFLFATQVLCRFSVMCNKNLGFQYWQMSDPKDSWGRVISQRGLCVLQAILCRLGGPWQKDPPLLSAAWGCTAGKAMGSLFVKQPWIWPQACYQRGSICESNCSPAVHRLPAGSRSIKSLLILLVTLHPWWACTKSFLFYYCLMHEIPEDKSLKILFKKSCLLGTSARVSGATFHIFIWTLSAS